MAVAFRESLENTESPEIPESPENTESPESQYNGSANERQLPMTVHKRSHKAGEVSEPTLIINVVGHSEFDVKVGEGVDLHS